MTDINSLVQVVLREAGYQTWLISADSIGAVAFEDDAVMGFACTFDDAATMLKRWRELETTFLTRHASILQKAGEKSWNIYSVFFCPNRPSDAELRAIRLFEENLERTRKIATCGVTTRDDVVKGLLPLLPIQYQPLLESEDLDLTQRLKKRIASIAPAAVSVALDNSVPPAEIGRLLRGEPK
jgi:hypothetical protein